MFIYLPEAAIRYVSTFTKALPQLGVCIALAATFGPSAVAQQVEFQYAFGGEGTSPGQLMQPLKVAIADDGLLYVTEYSDNSRVSVFDRSGNFQEILGDSASNPVQFDRPTGIVLSTDGNLFVADAGLDRIVVVDRDGNHVNDWPTQGSLGDDVVTPALLAADDRGFLYVPDFDQNLVEVYSPEGAFQYDFAVGTAPVAVAFDSQMRLYSTARTDNEVSVFDTVGDFEFSFPFDDQPNGIALDTANNVYVSSHSSEEGRIDVFDPDGDFLFGFDRAADFAQPMGITIDPTGLIFVADRFNHRIQTFRVMTFDGDLNGDGQLDVHDADAFSAAFRYGTFDDHFDLNDDGELSVEDLTRFVHDDAGTWIGDANLDGEFNSSDLVQIFAAGQYEDAVEGNSNWSDGDWNGDNDFTTSDLVFAFADGGYEQGLRGATRAVPEPSAIGLLLATLVFWPRRTRRPGRDSG